MPSLIQDLHFSAHTTIVCPLLVYDNCCSVIKMQSSYKLHVGILGAGLAGLSTAVCLARYGHHVHVYEASPQLSELGAGIQVPPNAMRLLDAWDLSLEFEQYASKPDAENLRRYSNGKLIGQQRRNMKQSFGYEYDLTPLRFGQSAIRLTSSLQ